MGRISLDIGSPRKCAPDTDKGQLVQDMNDNFNNLWILVNKLKDAVNENYQEATGEDGTGIRLDSISDDNARKNTLYYSTTQGAPAYKDSSGTVKLIDMT